GVVVYEWLCGTRPFEGSLTEVMIQHLTMPPPPLRERMPAIPVEVEQVVLRALAKDPKERFASAQDFATALERARQLAPAQTVPLPSEQPSPAPAAASTYSTVAVSPSQLEDPTEVDSAANLPVRALEPTVLPGTAAPPDSTALPTQPAATPAVLPHALEPTTPVQRKIKSLPRTSAALLVGLVVVVIAGGILGSLSLLAHFGKLATHSGATLSPVGGGTWTIGSVPQPDSLIPNGSIRAVAYDIDQALYLPLFYSDAQGVIHPGAASEVPTVQNGGINA